MEEYYIDTYLIKIYGRSLVDGKIILITIYSQFDDLLTNKTQQMGTENCR